MRVRSVNLSKANDGDLVLLNAAGDTHLAIKGTTTVGEFFGQGGSKEPITIVTVLGRAFAECQGPWVFKPRTDTQCVSLGPNWDFCFELDAINPKHSVVAEHGTLIISDTGVFVVAESERDVYHVGKSGELEQIEQPRKPSITTWKVQIRDENGKFQPFDIPGNELPGDKNGEQSSG